MLTDWPSLWDDLMRAQLEYIKANYENADVIFNNGNFGFMKDLANIRTCRKKIALSTSHDVVLSIWTPMFTPRC